MSLFKTLTLSLNLLNPAPNSVGGKGGCNSLRQPIAALRGLKSSYCQLTEST